MRGRARNWVGGIARIAAFVALFIALGFVFAAGWRMIPATVRDVPFLETLVTAAAAVAAGLIMIRAADGRPAAALGLGVSRMTAAHAGVGVLIGAGALTSAALLLIVTGTLEYAAQEGAATAWLGAVAAQAAIFTLAAFAEEVLFRGYAFQVLVRTGGAAFAAAFSAALFALAHAFNPAIGTFALINIFLAGILLAVAYLKTLSLWFATAVHMGWNWAMATLFDLPVSGIQEFDTPLYEPAVHGPAWWSGALFGPEGGLVGTIGFGVALLAILRWRAVRADPVIAAARPLVLRTDEESNVG